MFLFNRKGRQEKKSQRSQEKKGTENVIENKTIS